MSYSTYNVSLYGKELDFITTFAARFATASNKILLTTDIAEEFSDTQNTPEIEFSIGNVFYIKFVRIAALTSVQNSYYVYTTISGSEASTGKALSMSTSTASYTTDTTRTWKFAVAENQNVLHIRLGSYDCNLRSPTTATIANKSVVDIMLIKEGNTSICGYNTIYGAANHYSVMQSDFVIPGVEYTSATAANRLVYTYDPSATQTIETIADKVFLTASSTDRKITTSSLMDCSNINREQVFTMNSKKYYSVDSNTLMEV